MFGKRNTKVNNMYTHKAEQHYFDLYYPSIQSRITPNSTILDIGCQNGRFTIPLANAGHSLTATDIDDQYFEFIKSNVDPDLQVEFYKEKIEKTISRAAEDHYDCILCLELLYTMKNTAELVTGLRTLLKPGGLLVTSHRSLGYYIYRYIKERNFKDLNKILNDQHPAFNCQTPDQLETLYSNAGFEVEEIKPIGLFSGFSKDPFSFVADPEDLNDSELRSIKELELNPIYQGLFANNARYLMVHARIAK